MEAAVPRGTPPHHSIRASAAPQEGRRLGARALKGWPSTERRAGGNRYTAYGIILFWDVPVWPVVQVSASAV